ncbi:MAG: TonB-dependent receptor [Bdellovibrionales bacterium]|nr:TonB-dependent receptor [Bdellovibrionales bacterium]
MQRGWTSFISLAGLLGLFLVVSPVQAEESGDLGELTLTDLLNLNVESASKKVEPLSETPVPMTVITKEMIEAAGVRNIHEAMVLFVPGYTDVEDRNELNFAPRGIYASSQQKVLVMINGHRINSRSYLTAMPDYGIALHNVERIEVLRGPGSSLYGNVALAGVINLITKKGKDLAGKSTIDFSGGNHGQRRGRFLTGDGGDNWDMLAWGQYYRAAGEIYELDGNEKYNTGKTGEIRIDGVDKQPSHDVGMTYKRGKLTVFGASRRSQWIEPYGTDAATSKNDSPYNYDNYRPFNEAGPGLGLTHRHLGLTYEGEMAEGWNFSVNPYADTATVSGILATSTGGGSAIQWQEEDIGMVAQVNHDYEMGSMKGTFLAGIQLDAFELTDSVKVGYTSGDYSSIDTRATQLLDPGSEAIYSGFFQAKHRFSDQWILNAGARYDYKNRMTYDNTKNLSPRLALIYLPNDSWEFKASYSQSFVDAPYWYRYTTLATFAGSENLEPELLDAVQLQMVWKSADKKFRNATTIYQQNGRDLVAVFSAAPFYRNTGELTSAGIENEFGWIENKYQTFFNLQYYQASDDENYFRSGSKIDHVPQITANLIFNYFWNKNVLMNAAIQHVGSQIYDNGSNVDVDVDAATTINLGVRWMNIWNEMYLDARGYNVTDAERYQGGRVNTQIPFRQAGAWYMATVGMNF